MLRYAFTTLRARKAGFIGAFLALFCATAMVTACGALLETGLRGTIETERYRAIPIVVAGDQNVHQVEVAEKEGKEDKVKHKSKPIFERVWLPDETLALVESVPGVEAVVPEVNFPAHVVTPEGDVIPGPDAHPSWGHAWDSAALTPFGIVDGQAPTGDDDLVVDEELAERAGLSVGDRVTVQATQAPSEYDIVGIAAAESGPLAQQSSLFFTAAEAERLSGRPDQVAVAGVIPEPGIDDDTLHDDVAAALEGTTARVHSGADRGPVEFLDASNARVQLISMGGAMAGTSILVAVLVVVGTFTLSIQQRYRELALLRAVAATPRQVRQLIGREALMVGLAAGMLGAVAGVPLARWLRSMFVQLGAVPETLELSVSPFPSVAAAVVTILGAWAAARISARRTARIRPAEALAESAVPARLIAPGRLVAGIVVLAGGVVLAGVLSNLRTEPASGPVTFLVVVVLATAVALLGPLITRLAVTVLGAPLRLSRVGGYLASANARANAGRLAAVLTPLSLMIAMACTVVFVQTTMADAAQRESEAGSVADRVLVADGPGVPTAAAEELRQLDDVGAATEVLHTTVRVGLDNRQVQGVSTEGLQQTVEPGVTAGSLGDLDDGAVALSEVARDGFGLRVGDDLDLTMGDGTPLTLEVVAVYTRGLGFGDLMMDHDVVAAHVDNPLSSSVLIKLADGAVREDLLEVVGSYPGLRLLDRDTAGALRAEQQQSNAEVNYVALGLVVAFTAIAVVNTLAMSTAERFREFALLQLVGSTRRQVRRMLWLEAITVVVIATVIGTAISLTTLTAFSAGMTGTAEPSVTPGVYASIVGVATVLALLATLIPGRIAMTVRPEEAIGQRE